MSSGCEKLEVISDNNAAVSSREESTSDESSDNIISKGTFQFSKLGYFGVLFDDCAHNFEIFLVPQHKQKQHCTTASYSK